MKTKTKELIGPALDWAVAKCEGYIDDHYIWLYEATMQEVAEGSYHPSTDWAQGGPIIERELIRVIAPTIRGVDWIARIKHGLPSNMNGWFEKTGPTPLIAAMRCYVASKLGDSVEVPDSIK